MTHIDELLGRLGGQMITSAAAVTDANLYLIHVLEAATFTVCNEKDFIIDTATNTLMEQNLAGISVPAGAILKPRKKMFSDITISAGKLYAYKGD